MFVCRSVSAWRKLKFKVNTRCLQKTLRKVLFSLCKAMKREHLPQDLRTQAAHESDSTCFRSNHTHTCSTSIMRCVLILNSRQTLERVQCTFEIFMLDQDAVTAQLKARHPLNCKEKKNYVVTIAAVSRAGTE